LGDEWVVHLIYLDTYASMGVDLEDHPDPLFLLTNMLEYYCFRDLTHEADAINAVSGILRIVSTSMNSGILEGLPTVALDHMLLFVVTGYKQRQYIDKMESARRRKSFPSWSWAGWIAAPSWASHTEVSPLYPEPFNHWLDHGTWITWFTSKGSELPKRVLEKGESNIPGRIKTEIYYSRTSTPDLSDRLRTLDTSRKGPTPLDWISPAYSQKTLLRFFTVSLTCSTRLEIPARISWPEQIGSENMSLSMIDLTPSAAFYDVEGGFCGLLRFDIEDFLAEDGEYELTVFSDSQNSIFWRMNLRDFDGSNPFVTYQDKQGDWRLYWVMLLTWNDGVAERRGLGQILQSAVEKSFPPGPQWKEIVMG
jgi:hypothetical protein